MNRRWRDAGLLIGLAVIAAGCGTSYAPPNAMPASNSTPASANSAFTVAAAQVDGVGTVLVNGDGRTFYILSSEKGGKITCTDANGCTKVWPDTELPSDMTQAIPGSGIQSSLLGTVKAADGHLYVTYGGWPLYTFTGDGGPMQVKGQGIVSFGGTWTAIGVDGNPAVSSSSSAMEPPY